MTSRSAETSSLPSTALPATDRQRWVRDVLPFATSLMLHAVVIIVALVTVRAIQIIKTPPIPEQLIIPVSDVFHDRPDILRNAGPGENPFRQAEQDQTPDGANKLGWAEKPGPKISIDSTETRDGNSSDAVITVGAGGGFRLTQGTAPGAAADGGTGLLKSFGTPGGGGMERGLVFEPRGNAATIIFVCDCTGSMINKIAQLKIELSKAVQNLKPIQSFNIIFYQDEKVLKLNEGGMIAANSENKRKAETWLGDIVTAGTTDPVPALAEALKAKPQLMYFLTDAADFPDVPAVQNIFRKLNVDHKTKVNTILFVESKEEQEANKESEPLMQGISGENGGFFKWVRLDQLN